MTKPSSSCRGSRKQPSPSRLISRSALFSLQLLTSLTLLIILLHSLLLKHLCISAAERTSMFTFGTLKNSTQFFKKLGKVREKTQSMGRIVSSPANHHTLLIALPGQSWSAHPTEKSLNIKLQKNNMKKHSSHHYSLQQQRAADKERSWPRVTQLQSWGFKGQSRLRLTSQTSCFLQPAISILSSLPRRSIHKADKQNVQRDKKGQTKQPARQHDQHALLTAMAYSTVVENWPIPVEITSKNFTATGAGSS